MNKLPTEKQINEAITASNEDQKALMDKAKLHKVNRVEVIDNTKPVEQGGGRAYTKQGKFNVSMELQDNNKTLKIFIK